jgi:hypothetical protein
MYAAPAAQYLGKRNRDIMKKNNAKLPEMSGRARLGLGFVYYVA